MDICICMRQYRILKKILIGNHNKAAIRIHSKKA